MIPKIAIIGVGTYGEFHLRAFSEIEREGRAKLVGAADINADLLAKRHAEYGVATFLDYREMIAATDPHAVAIVTPDFLHREIALFCLRAGRHVLAEKPLDVTVEGCREMIAAAEENGRLLQVDFHKRWDPYHRELRQMVARGSLGEVLYGYAHIENRVEVPRDWFPGWAPRSSPVWFLGVHVYDLIRFIAQSDGLWVSATGSKKKLAGLGVDTYDAIQAKLLLKSGASFTIDTAWVLPDAHEAPVNQGIRVVGTEGMLELDTQDRGARGCFGRPALMQTLNLGFLQETRDRQGRPRYSGYGIEAIRDFVGNVSHLLAGGSLQDLAGNYPSGYDGLEATKIAVAVHASVSAGGAVVPV